MAVPLRFRTEFGVSTQNDNTQTSSSTTRLADGRVVVVWTDAGANTGDVKYQMFSPDGQPIGAERTANAGTAGLQGAPRVAGLADGGFAIVWQDFASDAFGDIRFRRFDTQGDAFDLADVTATAVTTGQQKNPSIVATPSGGFLIGWEEGNTTVTGLGSSTAAMLQEINQFGGLVGAAYRVSGNFGGDYAPQMAMDGNVLLMVWDDDSGPTIATNAQDGIYTDTIGYPLAGGSGAGGTRVDTGTFREASSNPDITYSTTLGRLIVWDDITTGSVGRDIYVDVNGLGPVRVNTTTASDQSNAQVVALAFGGYAVVWQDAGGTAGDIRARVYDSAGVATSNDFLVTSAGAATAGAQTAPDVVALLDGRFMVTWTDNSAGGIEGMIFDPRTAPVDWGATGPGAVWFRGTDFAAGDTIVGASGDDTLDGGAGNDTIIGFAGQDRMIGGLGADQLAGSFDSDIYEITDAFDTILEGVTEGGFDQVVASVNFVLAAGVHVEGIVVSEVLAPTAAINLTGNAFAQIIVGNGGINRLEDGLGASDTLIGGAGNDVYVVRNAGTLIVDGAAGGTNDAVFANVSFALAADDNVELLATLSVNGTTAINLTGNTLSQRIFGNAAANRLESGAGAADTLIGGGGNDTYFVRNAATLIVENAGQGNLDTVSTSVSFALAADDNIEVLSTIPAAGITPINLTGNALSQTIRGNAGANSINGRAGLDTLTGGAGVDRFVFNTTPGAANVDRITDFTVGVDKIVLENLVFPGLLAGGLPFSGFASNLSGLATDPFDRIIYESDTGKLFYDFDGNGLGPSFQFAVISTGLTLLSATDFVII